MLRDIVEGAGISAAAGNIRGPNMGTRYTIIFHGSSAASRHAVLQVLNWAYNQGAWREVYVKRSQGNDVRVYLSRDQDPRLIQSKRIAREGRELLENMVNLPVTVLPMAGLAINTTKVLTISAESRKHFNILWESSAEALELLKNVDVGALKAKLAERVGLWG